MPKYVNADELLKSLFERKEELQENVTFKDLHKLYAYNFAIILLSMAEPAHPETIEEETERATKELEAFKRKLQETHKD